LVILSIQIFPFKNLKNKYSKFEKLTGFHLCRLDRPVSREKSSAVCSAWKEFLCTAFLKGTWCSKGKQPCGFHPLSWQEKIMYFQIELIHWTVLLSISRSLPRVDIPVSLRHVY